MWVLKVYKIRVSKVVDTQQSFVQHCCVYRRVLLDLPNKAAPSFAQKTCFREREVYSLRDRYRRNGFWGGGGGGR